MKEITLQIKPVGNHCNLSCSYCYAAPFKSNKFDILDIQLLEKLLIDALNNCERLIITWHGGEPTLAGLDYFKKYVKIIEKHKKENQEVINMIQTNATLIDDEFAIFLKANNFIVSVSIDGPKKVHNQNRYDYKKTGSFNKAMKGVAILRRNGIYPPVIATITKKSLEYCEATLDFFVNSGFKEIKFSPVYDSIDDNFSISCEKWTKYISTIFHRWLELEDERIKIREIDEVLVWYTNKALSLCSSNGTCLNWISIDEQGNLYPCEYLRISNSYGNIKYDSLQKIFKSRNYLDFKKQYEIVNKECKKCKLFNMCHNGCPATRIKGDTLTYKGKYVYCEQRKSLFKEIKKIMEEVR